MNTNRKPEETLLLPFTTFESVKLTAQIDQHDKCNNDFPENVEIYIIMLL